MSREELSWRIRTCPPGRRAAAAAARVAVASAGPAIVSGYDVALKMRPNVTDRTSYVIAPSGRIAFVHSEMNYSGHVKSTLAAVQAMTGK